MQRIQWFGFFAMVGMLFLAGCNGEPPAANEAALEVPPRAALEVSPKAALAAPQKAAPAAEQRTAPAAEQEAVDNAAGGLKPCTGGESCGICCEEYDANGNCDFCNFCSQCVGGGGFCESMPC